MAKILLNVELNSKAAQAGLNELKNSLKLIADSLKDVKPNKDLTEQIKALSTYYKNLANAAQKANKVETERAALEAKLAKLEAEAATAEAKRSKATSEVAIAAEKAAKAIEQTKEATEKTRAATEKANLAHTKAKQGIEQLATAVEKRKQAEEKTNQEAAKTLIQEEKLELQAAKTAAGIENLSAAENTAAQVTETLGMRVENVVARYAKFYAASLLVRKPLQMITSLLGGVDDALIETENKVIEIQRVLNKEDMQTAGAISERLYGLAEQYGQTFDNVSTLATNFARAGRTWNESIEATEAALLAMNVAELSASEASDGLLSIIQQFGMETSDLITVVDKLNKTADKNPVTTGKLLEAIKRVGSTAKQANVSFEETLALITAISESTNRSGENIGTAINSLIQYSTKSVDVFAGLSDESAEVVERFKLGLASITDVWKQVAMDIHNDKSVRDALIDALDTDDLDEINDSIKNDLGDLAAQLEEVYGVANMRRKNYFVALLDNMVDTEAEGEAILSRYSKVIADMEETQYYSQEENIKYLSTYDAKLNSLKAAWQELANDEQGILGFKKQLVEIGIDFVNLIDVSGGLLNTFTLLTTTVSGFIIFLKAEKIVAGWQTLVTTIIHLKDAFDLAATSAMTAQAAMGWVGIAIMVVGGLATAVKAVKKNLDEQRNSAIALWKEHETSALKLEKLCQQYSNLTTDSEEYYSIEEQIVSLLSHDKQEALEKLTKGTDDYRQAVINLTNAELELLKLQYHDAAIAARDSVKSALPALAPFSDDYFRSYLRSDQPDRSGRSVGSYSVEELYEEYQKFIEKFQALEEYRAKLLAEGNIKQADALKERVDGMKSAIEKYAGVMDDYGAIVEKEEFLNNYTSAGESGGLSKRSGKYDALTRSVQGTTEALNEETEALEETAEAGGYASDSLEGTSDTLDELAKELEDALGLTEENTAALEEITTNIKDLSSQIDDVQSALSFLNTVQEEYNEYGSLSIDTLQKLLELGGEYLALIIDEEGQIRLNEEAVDALTAAKKDLLNELIAQQTQEYALNKLHEYMAKSTEDMGGAAVEAAQAIEIAAMAMAHFEGNEEGAKRAAEDFEEALHRLAMSEGVYFEDWEEDWVNDVKNFRSGLTSLYSMTDTSRSGWERSSGASKTSSSSSSSSGSTKDEYLDGLKAAVSLRESELTLMQHQGASQDEQIAKIQQIQAAIHDEAEYMRSIGASQEDINKLSSEWWSWQEKINKFAEDNAKAAEKAAEEAKKAAEEQQKAAEEAIKAETARLKQVLTDDKARLTLMEKQGKSVSERVEKMKEIQQHLHDEAEWLRQIGAEQAEIDSLSAEWWDWQEKILKLYQETLDVQKQLEMDAIQETVDAILKEIDLQEEALEIEEKRLAVDEARLNLQEAINKARIDYIQSVLSDYITSLSDAETLEQKQRAVVEAREKLVTAQREAQAKAIVDAFKAEKAVKKDTLSLEEKRLAVEQARQALIDAENERTTRVYNEASGQWEYQANAKNVQSARDNLASAIEALNAYVEEQAWAEVSEAVEKGSVSEAEVLEILAKWAKESWGNGSPEFVTKIREAFRKAMGSAASPDSVSGQISAVDSAVKSLNDYLKSEAIKELKQYIAAGNTDAAGMRSILDRWLSMGEGGELYEWRDGLMATLTDAIYSGYYDDTKVVSQVEAVERAIDNLHNYFRNKFKSELIDALKNGTVQDILDAMERYQNELEYSGRDSDLGGWAEMAMEAVGQRDSALGFWDRVESGQATNEDKRRIMEMMRANSEAWWAAQGDPAEQKRLADENLALGSMVGWHRNSDGRWYDEYGNIVYDKGGILHGQGGIKATNRPEAILDPDLTAQILRPGSDAQFRAFADALHLMFEHGNRTRYDTPVIRNPSVTDSHNTSYTVNGIPISTGAAERYTIAELFRAMPSARA